MRSAECGVTEPLVTINLGGTMSHENLKDRTKAFALSIITLVDRLPETRISRTIGGQILRAGTSVGANYRAACRAKSRADFISKMGTVEEEADESLYWMELLAEAKLVDHSSLAPLFREGSELLAIVVTSIKTARANKSRT